MVIIHFYFENFEPSLEHQLYSPTLHNIGLFQELDAHPQKTWESQTTIFTPICHWESKKKKKKKEREKKSSLFGHKSKEDMVRSYFSV